MFDAGINQIDKIISQSYDDYCIKTVREVGFDIDKKKLEKALTDAKSYYDEGYKDGYEDGKKSIDTDKKLCNITLYGCDDSTEMEVCLTQTEIELVKRLSALSEATSKYKGMPIMDIIVLE